MQLFWRGVAFLEGSCRGASSVWRGVAFWRRHLQWFWRGVTFWRV